MKWKIDSTINGTSEEKIFFLFSNIKFMSHLTSSSEVSFGWLLFRAIFCMRCASRALNFSPRSVKWNFSVIFSFAYYLKFLLLRSIQDICQFMISFFPSYLKQIKFFMAHKHKASVWKEENRIGSLLEASVVWGAGALSILTTEKISFHVPEKSLETFLFHVNRWVRFSSVRQPVCAVMLMVKCVKVSKWFGKRFQGNLISQKLHWR